MSRIIETIVTAVNLCIVLSIPHFSPLCISSRHNTRCLSCSTTSHQRAQKGEMASREQNSCKVAPASISTGKSGASIVFLGHVSYPLLWVRVTGKHCFCQGEFQVHLVVFKHKVYVGVVFVNEQCPGVRWGNHTLAYERDGPRQLPVSVFCLRSPMLLTGTQTSDTCMCFNCVNMCSACFVLAMRFHAISLHCPPTPEKFMCYQRPAPTSDLFTSRDVPWP